MTEIIGTPHDVHHHRSRANCGAITARSHPRTEVAVECLREQGGRESSRVPDRPVVKGRQPSPSVSALTSGS